MKNNFYKYKNMTYSLVVNGVNWLELYKKEKNVLKNLLSDSAIGIFHIGSTSIPCIAAKPIIDIMCVVKDLCEFDNKYSNKFRQLGYCNNGCLLGQKSRLFERKINGKRVVIVHVYECGYSLVKRQLAIHYFFKNYPYFAKEYERVKLYLYNKYKYNYIFYQSGKRHYLKRLIRKKVMPWFKKKCCFYNLNYD